MPRWSGNWLEIPTLLPFSQEGYDVRGHPQQQKDRLVYLLSLELGMVQLSALGARRVHLRRNYSHRVSVAKVNRGRIQ